mgnify:FL=1
MQLKNQTYNIYQWKYLIFIAYFTVVACNRVRPDEFLADSPSSHNNHAAIDSLIKIISNDTIALSSYLALSVSNSDAYAIMSVYESLGKYFLDRYQYAKAIYYYGLSLEAAENSHKQLDEIRASNNLAIVYEQIAAYNESAEYYFKAMLQTRNPERGEQKQIEEEKAKTLNGLGKVYLSLNQPDGAIDYFEESLRIELKQNDIEGQAQSFLNIGMAYEQSKRYDSAYAYYNKSLEYRINLNSASGVSNCFVRIGNLYKIEGDYENASVYLESAYNSLLHTSDRVNWLNACLSLGEVKIKQGHFSKAATYLNEGLIASGELNLIGYLGKVYFLLSELHRQEGKASLALEERSLSDQYSTMFYGEKNSNRIMVHRLNYEREIDKAKMNVLNEEHQLREQKIQKTIYATLLLITLLIIIIAILIQNSRLRKHKNQASLEMEQLKSRFYMKTSQEFKTPASIIIGLVERLKKNLKNNDIDHSIELEILSRQSENLFLLINEIATVDNLQENDKSDKMVNSNIISYFRYLYECFSSLAETKKINYVFHSNVSEIYMDYIPEYLRIIMNNLIGNAMKYCMDNNITVSINCDCSKKNYTIEVSDSGPGISEIDLPHVFDLYFQGNGDKNADYSSGVGLTITKQVVKKMNGTIDVKSEPNNKTIFTVVLPMHNCRIPQSEEPVTIHKQCVEHPCTIIREKPLLQTENNEKPVVLIVEENRDMSYYLTSVLKDKYIVLTERNGEDAIKTAQEKIPDLIISDAVLPLVDGFQLCKKIKRSVATNHIPVILLTLINSKEERIRGIEYGADAFLSKPVYEDELLVVMDQLLSTRKQLREKYNPFMRLSASKEENTNNSKNVNLDFLEKVTNHIYKELTNTDNIIERISSEVCLSSSQLNRKMKAITGMTTTNYILKTRLNKAKKLLIHSQKPIGDIATECGFNDFAYFSRTFKKEFGMTPTSFQRITHYAN